MLLALATIFAWLRPPALAPLQEGRRLIDAIGWAAVLPQMLAALGVLFAAAGVGDDRSARSTRTVIPEGSIFLTVAVFGLGMALFTMIMGNAFAAFPVMAAAIGVPLLIQALWRRSGGGRRGRHARRLLRDADDARWRPTSTSSPRRCSSSRTSTA